MSAHTKGPQAVLWGYGIVDKDGNAWWDETCCCEDEQPMHDILANLNDEFYAEKDARAPYRIVALYALEGIADPADFVRRARDAGVTT